MKLLETTKQVMSDVGGAVSYRTTIDQGIEYWRERKKSTVVEHSLIRYDSILDNFRIFLKEEYPRLKYVDETQKDDHFALNFRDHRLKLGRAHKTIRDEESVLSDLFKLLIKKKKITSINPFSDLEPLSVEPVQQRRVIPNGELARFFSVARQESGQIFWHGIFMTLYMTAMRRDEVRLMKKLWVNFETGHLEIPQTKTKKGKVISKTVPIHPDLKPVLLEAVSKSKSEYVFPNKNGNALPRNAIRDKMLRVCAAAGIPKATPHDFRHTWSTKARLAGMSNEARRGVGGWSSDEVMNSTYTHYPEEKIKDEYFDVNFLDFENDPILNATLTPQIGNENVRTT